MKKILASVLALTMVASMSVTAFAAAEPVTSPANGKGEGGYAIGVDGKYVAGTTVKETISVDIAWEKMEFTYTGGGSSYSPDTHKTTTTAGSWNTDKKYIEVKNHSNVPVTAEFSFTQGNGVTTTGSFYDKADATTALDTGKQSFDLVSGEDKTTEGLTYTVPSNKIYFGVSGDAIDADKALGTITVKIAKTEEKWTIVKTESDLRTALKTGGNIKLDVDITGITETLLIGDSTAADVTIVLDLNGHTISKAENSAGVLMLVSDDSSAKNTTLTIRDSSANQTGIISANSHEAIALQNACSLTVESGTIVGATGISCPNSSLTTVNIKGGTVSGISVAVAVTGANSNITIAGGMFSGEDCAIYLVEADGSSLTISGGTFSHDPSEWVDTDSYTVTEAGGKYTVTKK